MSLLLNNSVDIGVDKLQEIEEGLKKEILEEAQASEGNILVHDEVDALIPLWESVNKNSVQTIQEMMSNISKESQYNFVYKRIPVTPDKAPEFEAFDEIVNQILPALYSGNKFTVIFNCQFGQGRSTVGMVIAALIAMWRQIYEQTVIATSDLNAGSEFKLKDLETQLYEFLKKAIPKQSRHESLDGLAYYRHGNFREIKGIVSMMSNGAVKKKQVDRAVDMCNQLINLREDVVDLWKEAENDRSAKGRIYSLRKAGNYLSRYARIIAFNGYLCEVVYNSIINRAKNKNNEQDADNTSINGRKTFREWIKSNSGISSVIIDVLEHNSAEAFEGMTSTNPWEGVEEPEVASLVRLRRGNVLGAGRILKLDYVREEKKSLPVLDGAPNFRSVIAGGWTIYGVGQPTLDGARRVLKKIRKNAKGKTEEGQNTQVFWINLREEPAIYISGRGYVLREMIHPFHNLDSFMGVDSKQLEEIEHRIKGDIDYEMREGEKKGSKDYDVLVHDETENQQIVSYCVRVPHSYGRESLCTVREMFQKIAEEAHQYSVDLKYYRVPFTAERAPKWSNFEELEKILNSIPEGSHIVFNCQGGNARSTFGMIIAVLVCQWQQVRARGLLKKDSNSKEEANPQKATKSRSEGIFLSSQQSGVSSSDDHNALSPSVLSFSSSGHRALHSSSLPHKRRGQYHAIADLLKILTDGKRVKNQVDDIIDKCGVNVNIRDVVSNETHKTESTPGSPNIREHSTVLNTVRDGIRKSVSRLESQVNTKKRMNYLERYYKLILFNAYLSEAYPIEAPGITLHQWLANKPEGKTLWKQAKSNPQFALTLLRYEPQNQDPKYKIIPEENETADPESERFVVSERDGNVLSSNMILKSDHFPGCQRKGMEPNLPGCPNFRRIEHETVYGCAQSTIGGMVNALNHIQSEEAYKKGAPIWWINMREEPLIMINTRPFVVRKYKDPFKNLEITGINPARVEAMEQRLKQDVLADAERYGNKILLHDETDAGKMVGVWESVTSSSILTMREVYDNLSKEGYPVKFFRVPITDEMVPKKQDFEFIVNILREIKGEHHIIFNCQMGRGRTTTGTIIATLWNCIYEKRAPIPLASPITTRPQLGPSSPKPTEITKVGAIDPEQQHLSELAAGSFELILRLVRLLKSGNLLKAELDDVIDRCAVLQNLRSAIKDLKVMAEQETDPEKKHVFDERGKNYLERYFYLLAYTAYVRDQLPEITQTFSEWMTSKSYIEAMLKDFSLN